jgi:RNA-binding protein
MATHASLARATSYIRAWRDSSLIPETSEGSLPLSGPDRAHLRGLAHHVEPTVLTGHAGVTDAVLAKASFELEHHELVKVKVAEGPMEVDEAAALLVSGTSSELVQVIGRMVVLFKRRAKDPTVLLPGEKARKVAKPKAWLSTPKAKKTASRPWAKPPRARPAPKSADGAGRPPGGPTGRPPGGGSKGGAPKGGRGR